MRTNSHFALTGPLLLAAFAAGWVFFSQTPPAHILIGVDPSMSVEPNCPGVRRAAQSMLGRPGVREGSTLTVLAQGASPRAPQPRLRFESAIPIPGDQVYGPGEQQRRYEQDLEALLGGVETACEELAETQRTPLYEMVRQGLQYLHSDTAGCRDDGRCYFLLKSDLLEDVHPALGALLKQAAADPSAAVPGELVGSLDNAGVEVVFCGTNEVRPVPQKAAPPPSIETRQRIWNALFTHPELVSYQPFCTAASAPQ